MLKPLLDRAKPWFKYSETIFIARLKLTLGLVFTGIQQSGIDVASFVENQKLQMAIRIFFAYLIVDGTLTEWARRRNSDLQ